MLSNSEKINNCLEKIYSQIFHSSDEELRKDFESYNEGDVAFSLLDVRHHLIEDHESSYVDSLIDSSFYIKHIYSNFSLSNVNFTYDEIVNYDFIFNESNFIMTNQSANCMLDTENHKYFVDDNEEFQWAEAA